MLCVIYLHYMMRETLIFFLGFITILMPFIGVPSMWKRIVYVVLGSILMLVGYQLRRLAYVRSVEDHTGERKTEVYVEQVEKLFVEPGFKSDVPEEVRHELAEIPKVRARRSRTKGV